MNSENQKIKSKSKTLSLDFNSLKSMNDSNMNSIDKKIKNKYSSALDYLNSFSDKKSTIQNNSSINSEKFQKLKNEMLTSIYDNIHYSNYKTTNPQNYYLKQNNTRNNLLTLEKAKDSFKSKFNYFSTQQTIDDRSNKSTISSLYKNPTLNEKTKEKFEQIFNIINPSINIKQNDKKSKKEKKKKRALHYQLLDETSPLNHSFSINQKILAQSLNLCPSIKNFKKEEIKIDNNYILREKMKEKDIIPGLYYENEEDIKNLEKSLEKSIDKSFDKSYDKSLNQSDVQNLTQSNNQSLSYNEGSLNASRNSNTDGNAIMQQLHKLLSGSILSTNVEVDEENLEENEEDISENKDEDKKENDDEYISEKNEEQNESLSAGKPINEIEKENLNKSF